MTRVSRSLVLCGMLLAVPAVPCFAQKSVRPKARWTAIVRDEGLKAHAPKDRLIVDAKAFAKLWNAWGRKDSLPAIDFTKDFVFVGVVSGPNFIILSTRLADGNLKIVVGGTKRGGPGFGYGLFQFSRAGVKSVNGVALKPGKGKTGDGGKAPASYVRVEVKGKLRTGIVAIGGETTGTIITAGNITWELDLGRNARLRAAAKKLNGKTVVVKGTLTRKRGVEIRERWIVTVKSLTGTGGAKSIRPDKVPGQLEPIPSPQDPLRRFPPNVRAIIGG